MVPCKIEERKEYFHVVQLVAHEVEAAHKFQDGKDYVESWERLFHVVQFWAAHQVEVPCGWETLQAPDFLCNHPGQEQYS